MDLVTGSEDAAPSDIDGSSGRQRRRRQRRTRWRRRRRGRQCITPEIASSLAVRVTSSCCRSVDDGRGRRGDVRVNAGERLAASRRHGVCARTRRRASSLNETSHREGILAHLYPRRYVFFHGRDHCLASRNSDRLKRHSTTLWKSLRADCVRVT